MRNGDLKNNIWSITFKNNPLGVEQASISSDWIITMERTCWYVHRSLSSRFTFTILYLNQVPYLQIFDETTIEPSMVETSPSKNRVIQNLCYYIKLLYKVILKSFFFINFHRLILYNHKLGTIWTKYLYRHQFNFKI